MKEPNRDPRLVEAMEACRPGSDDLSDLGLAFLAEQLQSDADLNRQFRRLQNLDQSVAATFQDVPVPEGLADRILARLASAESAAVPPVAEPLHDEPPAEPVAMAPSRSRRVSRRWLLVGAGCLAVAATVLVAVLPSMMGPAPLNGTALGQLAIDFYAADAAEDGCLLGESPSPRSYPFSSDVEQFPGVRWRWVPDFLGTNAVAYDIGGPSGERATLYVVLRTAVNVPNVPPMYPMLSTHRWSTSAWQMNGVLYVLVVEGGPRSYQSLLVPQREPLT